MVGLVPPGVVETQAEWSGRLIGLIIFCITATHIFLLRYLAQYLLLYMLRHQLCNYWEEDKQCKKRISYKIYPVKVL